MKSLSKYLRAKVGVKSQHGLQAISIDQEVNKSGENEKELGG